MPAPRSASQPSYMPAGGSRPARPRAPEDAYFPRQPTYAAATLPSGRRDLYDDPQAEREREQVFRRGGGGGGGGSEHNPYDFVSTPTAPRPQARPQPAARGATGGAGLYGQLRVPRSGSGVSLSSDDGDSSLRGGAAPRPGMSRTASNSRGGRPGQMSRGRDEVDGLGMNEMNSHDPYSSRSGYNSYAHESPTHAYLEAFESYTHLPDPKHTLIRPSPSITSLGGGGGGGGGGTPSEKDGASLHDAARYDSNRYLSASDSRRNLSGAMGQSSSKPSEYGAVGGARGSGNAGYTKSFSDAATPAAKKRRGGCAPQSKRNRRLLFWGLPALIVIIGAVVVGVLFATKKVGTGATGSGGANGTNGTSNGGVVQGPVPYNASLYGVAGNGTNGSTVTTDLGVKFTYINPFGGNWAMDPLHPYQVGGRAQSWSPTVNENWIWGQHIVRGVNLGGWLVTEPFIVPGLYEQYQTGVVQAIDEYTLSQAMGANLSVAMEEHYRTFITEQDFADIAKVGLNWVRIPIGYWAIEAHYGEPYLQAVAWKYFVKAIGWARKYGLRILLDYHALPGSQNGWNHSGRGIGITNWMYGVMGITNAERSLEQLRLMTEFISQDGIKQVVPAISLVNEVMNTVVGDQNLRTFYYKAYNLIRGLTGVGAGNGPIIAIHEGFEGIAAWTTFLKGADRLALDQHPYLAFAGQNLDGHAVKQRIACSWGGGTNDTSSSYGIVLGGEWSNAINDCGKWLNGVNGQSGYNTIPGSLGCDYWEQWMKWNDTLKADINSYCQANMDALQNWFFWTWKIGNSTQAGFPTSPMWHYKLGVEQGWIPADPRGAGGHCQAIGVGGNQFDGKYPASAIGSASSQTLQNTTLFTAWPPTSLGPNFTDTAQIARFPTLTQTGAPLTLATAVHPANVSIGNGWAYSTDTTKAWVTVAGCTYPDAYNATASALVPATACTGSGGGKRSLAAGNEKRIPMPPRITPPPMR